MPGEQLQMVQIPWRANPFRGDRFEAAWAPAAEAVVKFGARGWAFLRSQDDPLHFDRKRARHGMQRWEHMSPEQREQMRALYAKMSTLDGEQRKALKAQWRAMTPDQRRAWVKANPAPADLPPPPPRD